MGIPIFQVDAFASKPFEGNPAGVCLLPEQRDERWMQSVALEMNLSETAFLVRGGDGVGLRWFTPKAEVDLCGHATLASAHVLWEEGIVPPGDEARFHTRSGLLTAGRTGDLIEMDFPAKPEKPATAPPGLASALGAEPLYVGRNAFDLIVLLEDEKAVRCLRPDYDKLSTIDVRGVIVTAEADASEFDFVSRFFAPAVGVNEDPVTGSAHCCLAPFWARRLGREEMTGYQASSRGGVVGVRLEGDRVLLRGRAVTIFKGEMRA
jgi:PhzF family phenazine biosynthesis protein